jgi:hypothetical protein
MLREYFSYLIDSNNQDSLDGSFIMIVLLGISVIYFNPFELNNNELHLLSYDLSDLSDLSEHSDHSY